MDAAAARSHTINRVRSVGILATMANVQEIEVVVSMNH